MINTPSWPEWPKSKRKTLYSNLKNIVFNILESSDKKRMKETWEKIKQTINSEFIKNKLIEARELSKDFRVIWDIIWDCVLYSTLFNDKQDNYFNIFINNLYNLYLNENFNDEIKSIKKAEIIAEAIANHLKISLTEWNSKKIREYFLDKYNKHWYVYHSFPSAYFEGISKSWLQAKNENKNDNSSYEEMKKIQKIFMLHWIYSALWWAWIYGWWGIYYDHKQWNIYPHAIFGPERFSFFTSSDHHTISSWIENEPFAFRDREHCRKNVDDLCDNAWLNDSERKEVISFFEEKYNKLSKDWSYVALIPKSKVWKTKTEFPKYIWYIPISENDSKHAHTQYKELINTIRYTLWDWWKDYQEHEWNVYYDSIKPSEMVIIELPNIKGIIKENIEFKSETKEQLTNKYETNKVKNEIKRIKETAPDRVPQWIMDSINDVDDESDSEEVEESEISLKIKDIFWLKSRESIEFKWKMVEYFKFYTDTIIPIVNKLKNWLEGTEYEILQHDNYHNHWFNQHTKNVVIRWIFYALMKWIDPIPVIIACTIHDLKHINIPWGWDKKHWPQAVPLVDIVVEEYNKIWTDKIDEDTIKQIKYAVENHMSDHWEPDSKPIAQCLNDADRTRLAWRDWYQEKYFSTDAGKTMANWKREEFIKYFDNIWIDYDKTSWQ